MNREELIKAAQEAKERAYAPYSRYAVGAALLTKDGHIHTGCNIENTSYGATICAERAALAAAIGAGDRHFQAIAIVGGTETLPLPCGLCRQSLSEFCSPELEIIVANTSGQYETYTLRDLHPHPFNLPSHKR